MKEKRRKLTPELKAEVLRKVLKDKRSVAEVCEEHALHVPQYYAWQREAFERMERLFEAPPEEQKKVEQVELRDLKEKLNSKTIFCRE
jgi:transposase-like protein